MALFYIKTRFCQEEARVIINLSILTLAISISCPSCSLIKIRFAVKRKKPLWSVLIRVALGMIIQGSLLQQAAQDLGYEIMVEYVELLPSLLNGEKGSGRCHLYKVLT